ncbi:MAG: broad specificity phosphatase PhoE [Paracoccaceae bacterium]|jgi:broad specificity phosphatase PhoE
MGEITLIRHGQANSAATDEDSYDQLSETGHQQAKWLGQYLRAQGEKYDSVLTGTLSRHISTVESMGAMGVDVQIDARLNEMDYFNLGRALKETHGVPMPEPAQFATHITQVMEAWHRAEIMGNETFADFEARVISVLSEATQPGKHVLCITSGGVIGMIVRNLLHLDPTRLAHVLLPIRNTSIHRIHVIEQGPILGGFNATPHLDAPERLYARTNF